ncbi:Aldehyde dehydrogenase [Mortierella sp. AD094]|nr:Aldehyde dehydrogenase [Mortierella sp. AD094]
MSALYFNSDAEIRQAVETTRRTFKAGHTKPLKFRRHQLEQLWRLPDEESDTEFLVGEIIPCKEDIHDVLEHLEDWTKDERVRPSFAHRFGITCLKRKEPKGSVLLISPWNFPVCITMGAFIGAIAAGCTAVLKLSEVAPHTAKALTELIPRYLDNRAYIVINGGPSETTKLLEHNGPVARVIMKAASQHVTPLTLELGGKSPVYIDESADIAIAAKRVAFGKFVNAAKTEEKFIPELKKAFAKMLGANPQASPDYARIINGRHFHRLANLLNGIQSEEIAIGGIMDEKDLYIAPTVITNVSRVGMLMESEIFGPILPVVRVADVDDAIEYIASRDYPLTLYIFSCNSKVIKKVMDSTRSGGILVNDTLMHGMDGSLPFGGVGASGVGSYHGKASFDTSPPDPPSAS